MKNAIRHLNALKAFEAVAKHSSMAKAANELNVSHSVVSNHIKNLEAWLNVQLFERQANRITLTDAGREFAPKVASGFQVLRDACDSMLQFGDSSVITVFAEPAIASRWLRKRISEFNQNFPNIEVNLISAWQLPDIDRDMADILVYFDERLKHMSGSCQRLFAINGFPACSPELLPQDTQPQISNDFLDLPLIHDNGLEIWHNWFSRYSPTSKKWEKGKIYSDLSLAIDAAIDGEGILLADHILCEKELTNGNLIPLSEQTINCTWYSMLTAEHAASIQVTMLTEWLSQAAEKHL